jgi:CubicO group peptidase (beta-lactamase class C family)
VDTCDASLDDNACQYLPEFKKDGRDSITLRQLMSHTSRLFDFPIDPYRCPAPDLFRIVCSYKAPAQSLYRRPYYNGTIAWVVLATVVERIYADPFVKIVTDMLSDSVPESRLRITNPDPACYVPCHLIKKGSFAPVPQPPHDILFRTPNPAHGGFGSAGDLGWLYAELVRCARGTGRLMGISTARQLIAGHCVVDVGLGFGLRTSGLGFMTDVRTDGLGGGWSRRSFGHAGYVGQHRVVHAFGDPDHEVAVAIQLFSVGAKNNWRFHKLGAAIWSDLLPGEERHDEAAS